jgi:hypothetical protein
VRAADRDRGAGMDVAEPVDPSLERRWRLWAKDVLGGSPGQVDAAAAAAVGVAAAGGRQTDAIGAAKRAWEQAGQPVVASRAEPAFTPVKTSRPPVEAAPVVQRPAAPHRPESVQGRVTRFQTRTKTRTESYWVAGQVGQPQMRRTRRIKLTVWSFYVGAPGSGDPIAVEMTGRNFKGKVADGDEVRIDRRPKRGKTLRINKLDNLSTGESVRAKGGPPVGTAKVIVTVIQIAIFATISVFLLAIVLPHLKSSM